MNLGLEKYRYYLECCLNNPIFRNVPDASIQELVQLSGHKHCEESTCILDPHRTAHHFFIIIRGKIKAYVYDVKSDRKLTLCLLSKNELFDLNALIGTSKPTLYYETLEATEMLYLPLTTMKEWLAKNPCLQPSLIDLLANQLKTLQELVTNIVMDDIGTRLAKLLYAHMVQETGKVRLINNISHDEIAAMIGTTRTVVNRQIQIFKSKGIIEVKRKHIQVANPDLLLAKLENANNGLL